MFVIKKMCFGGLELAHTKVLLNCCSSKKWKITLKNVLIDLRHPENPNTQILKSY